MYSTPQRGRINAVIEGDDQERQSRYSALPISSTNRSFASSRKRQRGDDATSSLTERAWKRLRREEPVSPMSISPREGMVFGGEEDFGARRLSMTEESPRSNEDGSGLRSPVFDFGYPYQVDVQDTARISNFNYSKQQQQPLHIDPSMHEDIHGANTQEARMGGSRHCRNTLLDSSFFAQSHNFTINGSHFHHYACSGSSHGQKRSTSVKQEDVTSTAFRVIPMHKLRTLGVIYTRKGYRFNSAKRKKSDVVVQVFEGSEARELWQKTLTFSRRLVNAHALDIIGVSPTSADSSDPHYIVFDGAGSRNTHQVIASMLRKGAMEATLIGLRAVHGVALGFDYISKAVIPLSDLGIDELDVFSDDTGHTRLTFTPNVLGSSTLMNRQLSTDLDVFNSFIKKIFNHANHTLHGDEADQHMKEEFINGDRLTPQMESAGDPEIPLVANTLQAAKRPPRRELIWNASGFSESSLSSISQTYDNVIFNDSIQLPRRFGRSVMGYRRACSCEGYTREEITFTPDAFRNAVLIYQQPSPNERCGQCGELLPEPIIFGSSADMEGDDKERRSRLLVDYDKQCGVINHKNLPCSRSLTCQSHSMAAKRAVTRSRPYDDLLIDWQRERNPNFVERVERETKEKKDQEKAERPVPARSGWRSVTQRTRKKKKETASPPLRLNMPTPTRPRSRSWATWQPDPNMAPSPASVEPTLLDSDGSPGLFGPRSPRDSWNPPTQETHLVIPPGAGPMNPPFGASAPVIPIDQYGPRMPGPVIPGMPPEGVPQPFIPPGPTILRVPGSPLSSSSGSDSGS